MKYLSLYLKKLPLALFTLSVLVWAACDKEVKDAPTIERVRTVKQDSTILGSGGGNTIAIVGKGLATTQKVFFNDYSAFLNPVYIKDDVILVQIPLEAPIRSPINKLKVVTLYGEALTDFRLIQPAPVVDGFSPSYGEIGDTITITGKDLDNTKFVYIGDSAVTILPGATTELLKVRLNQTSLQGLVTVETIGGASKSKKEFGFSYVLYDDKVNPLWAPYAWDSDRDMSSKEQVKRGRSIKMVYKKIYAGYGMVFQGANEVNPTLYQFVRFSMYSATACEIKFGVNINQTTNANSVILKLKPGWNEFKIRMREDLKNPGEFKELHMQEAGNSVLPTIYIDDFGLL
jgi:hypothetical protein